MPNRKNFWEPTVNERISQSIQDRFGSGETPSYILQQTDESLDQLTSFYRRYMPYGTFSYLYGATETNISTEKQKNDVAIKVLDGIKAAAQPFDALESKGDIAMTEAQKYRDLGLILIADKMEEKGMKAWKEFQISAAGYKRINQSELEKFRKELSDISDYQSKRQLIETPLACYIGQGISEGDNVAEADFGTPPTSVLEKLKVAQESKLFDTFSVLHIKYVPDPILCGKIKESDDLYFIDEWGEDVKLTDIVKE